MGDPDALGPPEMKMGRRLPPTLVGAAYGAMAMGVFLLALSFLKYGEVLYLSNMGTSRCEGCYDRPSNFAMLPGDICYVDNGIFPGPHMIALVTSHADDVQTRNILRNTVLRVTSNNTAMNVRYVFVVNSPESNDVQRSLEAEAGMYSDILQQDLHTAQRDDTGLALTGLEWTLKYCSGANYVVKMSADVFVNFHKLIRLSQEATNIENTLVAYCHYSESKDLFRSGFDKLKNLGFMNQGRRELSDGQPRCDASFVMMSMKIAEAMMDHVSDTPFVTSAEAYIGALVSKTPYLVLRDANIRNTFQYGYLAPSMDCKFIENTVTLTKIKANDLSDIWKRCSYANFTQWWRNMAAFLSWRESRA